jgi:hypothetical protein
MVICLSLVIEMSCEFNSWSPVEKTIITGELSRKACKAGSAAILRPNVLKSVKVSKKRGIFGYDLYENYLCYSCWQV